MRRDLSARNFVQSDFVMLNDVLAIITSVDVQGGAFRRVPMMGALPVLIRIRSSARCMCVNPPAPPRRMCPSWEIALLPIRPPACADCHRGIDGWGLAKITRRLPNRKTTTLERDARWPRGGGMVR